MDKLTVRKITTKELKQDIINKEEFPDAIFLNSSEFFKNSHRYIEDSVWFGLFKEDELLSAASLKDEEDDIFVELLETKIDKRRRGYASYFLKSLHKKYKKPFRLVSVDDDNLRFYKELGYTITYRGATTHLRYNNINNK